MFDFRELVDNLQVEQLDRLLFRGTSLPLPLPRVFGGQVLAQSLNAAHVDQNADPTGLFTHALADTKDDSATITNRATAPDGTGDLPTDPADFTDSDKNVPGTDLLAGEAIGVWLNQALGAAEAAFKDTYTTELEGTSV